MGNACCVAARDKMVVPNSSADENLQRSNVRHSPTWSFRWENRGRVAGEETSLSWLSDGISRNEGSEIKFESAFVSSEGSPLDSFRTHTLQKSPASDLYFPRNSSMDTVFKQKENDSTESPAQLSLSLPSQPSSFPTSPLLSQISRSSATEERQGVPLRFDYSQPSEGWSLRAFSEKISSSRCAVPLSYDNVCLGLQGDMIDHGNQISSHEHQTCGACSRPLSEKSLWSSQNIFTTNDLSVSAILVCGHVYHGECLEEMTLEIDKFDPSCPICTMGEKKTAKLSEKALEVEMDLKARNNKRLRNRVLDSDLGCDDFAMFNHRHRVAEAAGSTSPKLVSSSSVKSYSAKPFLARHFSFGSRGNSKSTRESLPVKKKGFFWTKSSKI